MIRQLKHIIVLTIFIMTLAAAAVAHSTRANASSPVGCKTDQYLKDIFCFQIIGPSGTTFVDVFQGTVQNVGSGRISIIARVYGPIYFDGPVNYWHEVAADYVVVNAGQTVHWFVPEFKHFTQGEYCAREWTFIHDSASVCWWVFANAH